MNNCRENTVRRPLSRLDFMGRLRALSVVLALAIAAALGLVACGGSDAALLPGDTAGEINSNLDQVEQLANEGDCLGASDAAQAVSLQVEELGGVDAKLKQALQEGAARLNEVVAGCEETSEEETAPSIDEAEEPEAEGRKAEKPAKSKSEKKAEEPEEEESSPTLPPQAEGKAKGHEEQEEEAPPVESDGGTPSGGVGPSTPAGGE
jgi:hypothetical protein